MSEEITCPFCHRLAEKTTGEIIYPNRPDLSKKEFFLCEPCGAYVGCHKDGRPLGSLANKKTRSARQWAHSMFDPLWGKGVLRRKDAYRLLAEKLGINVDDCHIGHFNVDQCKLVVEACEEISKNYLVWNKKGAKK